MRERERKGGGTRLIEWISMRYFAVLAAAGTLAACLAQDAAPPPQEEDPIDSAAAPAEVNKALRERVDKFYQMQIEGKFRQAEQYVAEDTKDLYYASQKPKYLKYEIGDIAYTHKFARATVTVDVDREVGTPAIGKMVMSFPQETTWKLEKGEWFWYVDPNRVRTPFGSVSLSQSGGGGQQTPGPRGLPKGPALEDVWKQVTADKTSFRFPYKAATENVVITSKLPGVVTLKLQPVDIAGLDVKLDRDQLAKGETAHLTLQYTPQLHMPKEALIEVRVEPTQQVIPIRVVFEPPAQEVK